MKKLMLFLEKSCSLLIKNLVPCQKQLEFDQYILNKIKFFFSDVQIKIMIENERFAAISTVSWHGILVKRLAASQEARVLQTKLLKKEFGEETVNIKLLSMSFKIKNYFSYKCQIPDDSKSLLVLRFSCPSCSSSNIGETFRCFKTRIEEQINKDNKFRIFQPMQSTATCLDMYKYFYFKIFDKANSKFD